MSDIQYDFNNIKAIIGLGNPGAKYYKTRHNIGFRVVDAFVEQYAARWNEASDMMHTVVMCGGDLFDSTAEQRSVYLIKPLTFMNSSGQVIPFLLKKGIKADEILVVHDELEKSFGKMVIKLGGSARGHNGLRSIESVIGKEYWRLRFGIGRPEQKSMVSSYVLSPFYKDEEEQLDQLLDDAVQLIRG